MCFVVQVIAASPSDMWGQGGEFGLVFGRAAIVWCTING